MARTHRLSTTAALIVCVLGTQWSGSLFASELEAVSASTVAAPLKIASRTPANTVDVSAVSPWIAEAPAFSLAFQHEELTSNAPAIQVLLNRAAALTPNESASFAQRGRYRGGRGSRNAGAATAIVLGAVASIAGAAVLVYANRPDCRTNPRAEACGYGTKVVGGAVLTGGLVGMIAGALTWR